uniref:Putative secreted protein n=1 Tax=Anopheles marajoara TaxID=58244 RepID=A0A2M4C6W4_9DIPT
MATNLQHFILMSFLLSFTDFHRSTKSGNRKRQIGGVGTSFPSSNSAPLFFIFVCSVFSCEVVRVEVLSYTPLCAHSLRSLIRSGVPGSGLPFRLCIRSPMLNIATPDTLPEHGRVTLNSLAFFGTRPVVLIEMVGGLRMFSSTDISRSKL